MMHITSNKHPRYWESTKVFLGAGIFTAVIGIALLSIAATWGSFSVPANSEIFTNTLQLVSFGGAFTLVGGVFVLEGAVAKGRHFRQIRSAVKNVLPQGERIQNENL